MAEITRKLQLPAVYEPLFEGVARYRVAYGGRGSAKSWTFARMLLLRSLERRCRILCAREFQVSISDSVHKLLTDQIGVLGLEGYFLVQQTSIVSALGSEFIFSGIRSNPTKIRSMEGLDICWVEEAEKVAHESWQILIPTIRKPHSEIWVTFNPDLPTDPTYERFVSSPSPDQRSLAVSWRDNPDFPEVLRAEKDYLARVDAGAYEHVWEGKCRQNTHSQVLAGKYRVESFNVTADWDGPYFGADWGFAQDPTTLIKCWVFERSLYLEYEAYGIGVDIDRTPALFNAVPDAAKYIIRADCARPETISYMRQHGFDSMEGVVKWSGSVEDGVAFLRQFESIVIHPRCIHAQEEARLWSYKTDRLTGDVLPELVDANNHIWDAVRYALEPVIRHGEHLGMLDYYRGLATTLKATHAQAS